MKEGDAAMTTNLPTPATVLVAGDWHGDHRWAVKVINHLPELVPDQPRLILQLGDFGFWPGEAGTRFLHHVSKALEEADGQLWWVDGNHDDHSQLDQHAGGPVEVAPRIWWLPRGYRWRWYDRTWLAVGGAVSVDRGLRREGVDWWPGEEITHEQATAINYGGHADVMVCHDAPAGVPLRLPPPASAWESELARAGAHRRRLLDIVTQVRPDYLLHGHYHVAHQGHIEMEHGPVRVTGFDREYGPDNVNVLDVLDMSWITGPYARIMARPT